MSSSATNGPLLPVVILQDVLDILGQEYAALTNWDLNPISSKGDAETWLKDHKSIFGGMLNLSAVNKQMRRSFWTMIIPKHVASDSILRVNIQGESSKKGRPVPNRVMAHFDHLMLDGEDERASDETDSILSADEGALGKNVIAALSSRNVKTLSLRASTFESICYHDPDDLHILAKAATHATHLHMHHNMDLTVLPDNSFEWMGAFKRVTLTSVWDMRNHPLLGDMGIFEQYGSHILPSTLPFTKKGTRKIRTLRGMVTIVMRRSENEDNIRKNGPPATPLKVFKTLNSVTFNTKIKTCFFCFTVRDSAFSDKHIWRGACQFKCCEKGHLHLTHEDVWQDPTTLLHEVDWKQGQVLEDLSMEEPFFDDHGQQEAIIWESVLHHMMHI